MLLLEVDGKALLARAGIAVPAGVLDEGGLAPDLPGAGPWIAKAQVPVGGRGKAGGVLPVASAGDLPPVRAALVGKRIKGFETPEILIEQACAGEEHYLALMLDAAAGGARLIYSPFGGIDIESRQAGADGYNAVTPLEAPALARAVHEMAATAPASHRAAILAAGLALAELFLARQLLLAEINPLFALPDGSVLAGDAKVVIDMNTLAQQPEIVALLRARQHRYPDGWRKHSEDFDFVEIDPAGQIGLVTTGAGLSMMLIDEMVRRGLAPYNFCDVRTGQMRGSPERLLRIFDWLRAAGSVRVLLVNVFAGITDLAEFTQLLVTALRARPDWRVPIVARLVGNGEAAARRIIDANPDLALCFEPDLERALDQVQVLLARQAAGKESAHAV